MNVGRIGLTPIRPLLFCTSVRMETRSLMNTPVFTNGQTVSVALSKQYRATEGVYRIIAAMPLNNGGFQYRIKGELEKYERVVDERHLAAE